MNLDHSRWGPHSLREEEEEMVPWRELCQEKIDGTWKRARRGFGGRKEKCCHNIKISTIQEIIRKRELSG